LFFVVLGAALFHFTPLRAGILAMLSALTFTINYTSIYFHHTGIFDNLWSLCVEEHSYLILGFLAYLVRREVKHIPFFILAIGVGALLNGIIQSSVFGRGYFDVFWRTDVACAPIFLAGYFFLFSRQFMEKNISYIAPFFVVLAVLSKSVLFESDLFSSIGTLLLSVAICFLDTAPVFIRRFLSFAPLRQIGLWSYSLYLWQQPFYKLIDKGYGSNFTLMLATVFSGLISFYIIERPIRSFINGHIASRRSRITEPDFDSTLVSVEK